MIPFIKQMTEAILDGILPVLGTSSPYPQLKDIIEKAIEKVWEDKMVLYWTVEDVRSQTREDGFDWGTGITDDECRWVLRMVEKHHNAEYGVNWEILNAWIDDIRRDRKEERKKSGWIHYREKLAEGQSEEDATEWGWGGPGWYFWNKDWAGVTGPFETKEIAEEAFRTRDPQSPV